MLSEFTLIEVFFNKLTEQSNFENCSNRYRALNPFVGVLIFLRGFRSSKRSGCGVPFLLFLVSRIYHITKIVQTGIGRSIHF